MNNQERIERYIRGQLTPGEIDQLWIEFLKAPEWYEIFEIELILRMMGGRKFKVEASEVSSSADILSLLINSVVFI